MKVLLVNGSPNKNGCTFTALSEVAAQLEKDGVGAEILHLGKQPINDCVDCGFCFKNGKCVFGDIVNETAARLGEFDGFVFGAPVLFSRRQTGVQTGRRCCVVQTRRLNRFV